MRKIIFLFLISANVCAQTVSPKSFKNKLEEFDFYAQPNKESDLSRYLKKEINTDLLKAIKFRQKQNFRKRYFLTFLLDENNVIKNIKVDSPYSELNNEIITAFKKYGKTKLIIPERNRLNLYTLQVIAAEENKAVIKCSSNVVYDRFPVFEGCESIKDYVGMKKCLGVQLENYIVKNLPKEEVEKAKIIGILKLNSNFLIGKTGELTKIKSHAPTEGLKKELDRLVTQFPKAKIPPKQNGNPTKLFYRGKIILQIEGETGNYEEVVKSSVPLRYNANNELAKHFKKYLSEDEVNNAVFLGKNKNIEVTFELDKNNKRINVRATALGKPLNDKIVSVFKKFSIDRLNIKKPSIRERYAFNVITRVSGIHVVECNDIPDVHIFPIFNKKCKRSKSYKEFRDCFNKKISNRIAKRFNTSLQYKTKLKKDIQIKYYCRLDTLGNIVNVHVKSPNPFLTNEVEKIIKEIPSVYKPAYKNGKVVNISMTGWVRFVLNKSKTSIRYKKRKKSNNYPGSFSNNSRGY